MAINPYLGANDPTQQPQYKGALLAALNGGAGAANAASNGGFTGGALPNPTAGLSLGNTTEPTKAEAGGGPVPPVAKPAYDTTGLDPNNPIDAIFIKNQYGQNGIGSGFGDLAYWRAHPDQAARLDADQRGVGHDMPGPGDVGNTSFDPNAGRGGGGVGLVGPSIFAGSGINPMLQSNASDNINNALQNIGAMANGNGYLQSLIAALNSGGR